jgi:hypothetical protein
MGRRCEWHEWHNPAGGVPSVPEGGSVWVFALEQPLQDNYISASVKLTKATQCHFGQVSNCKILIEQTEDRDSLCKSFADFP